MEERSIRVPRTARYHVLGKLEAAPTIWIVLHGYGQLARYFLNSFAGLEGKFAIVAPEGLSRFYLDAEHARVGATWMTREDRVHEIEDHIAYLDLLAAELRRTAMPGASINVLGFSQGVATASRWAARGSTPIGRLVLWAGTLPPDLETDTLRQWKHLRVDLVAGEQDALVPASALHEAARRLEVAGVAHQEHLFNGAHKLESALLARLLNGL